MSKKPKVFQNIINKELNNNHTVSVTRSNEVISKKDVNEKIREILNSKNYIYKAKVSITTQQGIIERQIIGKKDDYLMTIDNELIPIANIIDIQRKN